MSCEQAGEIDFERFLLESETTEFDAFRAHFLNCSECAAAVSEWTAFDLALQNLLDADGRGRMSHPEPERLEQFSIARDTLGAEAEAIERHLIGCGPCRTELAVMARYESEFLAATAIESTDGHRATERVASLGGVLEWLRRLVERPGFDLGFGLQTAAALSIVLLGLWWSGVFGDAEVSSMDPGPRVARQESEGMQTPDAFESPSLAAGSGLEREAVEAPPGPIRPDESPTRVPSDLPSEAPRIANAESAPAPVTPSNLATRALPVEVPSPVATASTLPAPSSSPGAPGLPALTALEAEGAPRDEILLAALTDLPLPSYVAPAGAESLGWIQQFGAVRAGPTSVAIEIRAPANHAGLTLSAAPRLWWSLSQDTDLPVQVTVVDDRELDPVLRADLPGAFSKGLHSIDLAAQGVELEPDVEYRWFVSLIVDPERPSRNPVAAGALKRVADSDERREIVGRALPTELGHTYARLGLWYDAFDFFASIAAVHPDFEPVTRHRERLVELAGGRP